MQPPKSTIGSPNCLTSNSGHGLGSGGFGTKWHTLPARAKKCPRVRGFLNRASWSLSWTASSKSVSGEVSDRTFYNYPIGGEQMSLAALRRTGALLALLIWTTPAYSATIFSNFLEPGDQFGPDPVNELPVLWPVSNPHPLPRYRPTSSGLRCGCNRRSLAVDSTGWLR
jgi:hypothetical protein